MSSRASALELARDALRGLDCWVVGGTVRDELLGCAPSMDLDLVIAGEVAPAARTLARAAGATAFSLSDDFGAWRVVSRSGGWQADLNPLRGASLEADLLLRDFTINAIARPLRGGELIDPLAGARDLAERRLRIVAPAALEDDPLRALRLVRLACELDLEAEPQTREAARAAAPGLARISSERVYAELRRVVASKRPGEGMRLALELGLCAVVLPELEQLRGVEQSHYHHLDALDHTLAVLDCVVELQRDVEAFLGSEHAEDVRVLLARPLADELTRGDALRFGALVHDIAKSRTRVVAADGRVGFPGHDLIGAETARAIFARLRAAERIRAHVAALTRNHLRLGFLVARAPLERRELYHYLDACEPVWADVTLLSVADRAATRGARSEEAIQRHLELARSVIGEALRWQRQGRPPALLRGDELAAALGLAPGPLLGELLGEIEQEAFVGELRSPQDAIAFAAARIA
jgi:putative nucleotidyltransferase with HDIG domain